MSHARDLFNACPWDEKALITPVNMTHNDFLLEENLITPVLNFQRQIERKHEEQSKREIGRPTQFQQINFEILNELKKAPTAQ